MNVASIFRDTANQLTTGVGKVINNIVDFFSNLSSGITGLFNTNAPFREVLTGAKPANSEFIIIINEVKGLRGDSISINNNFSGNQYEICNSIYGSGESGYEKIDDSDNHIYQSIDDSDNHIYESIDENFLDKRKDINKPEDGNNSVKVEGEYILSVDSINFYEEDVYVSPSGDTLSEENSYDTIPTDDELLRLFLSKIKIENGTKFNTI